MGQRRSVSRYGGAMGVILSNPSISGDLSNVARRGCPL